MRELPIIQGKQKKVRSASPDRDRGKMYRRRPMLLLRYCFGVIRCMKGRLQRAGLGLCNYFREVGGDLG